VSPLRLRQAALLNGGVSLVDCLCSLLAIRWVGESACVCLCMFVLLNEIYFYSHTHSHPCFSIFNLARTQTHAFLHAATAYIHTCIRTYTFLYINTICVHMYKDTCVWYVRTPIFIRMCIHTGPTLPTVNWPYCKLLHL